MLQDPELLLVEYGSDALRLNFAKKVCFLGDYHNFRISQNSTGLSLERCFLEEDEGAFGGPPPPPPIPDEGVGASVVAAVAVEFELDEEQAPPPRKTKQNYIVLY